MHDIRTRKVFPLKRLSAQIPESFPVFTCFHFHSKPYLPTWGESQINGKTETAVFGHPQNLSDAVRQGDTLPAELNATPPLSLSLFPSILQGPVIEQHNGLSLSVMIEIYHWEE